MRVPAGDPTREPDVSVIMVNWNSGDLLRRSIAALEALADDVTFEVVVVDNGSVDGSADRLHQALTGVTIIPLGENVGFGAANNIGFKRARGRYLLLLNPDTQALPGMLSTMVAALDADPAVGCVGAKHYNPDMSLQWSIDNSPTLLSETIEYCDLHRIRALEGWLRRKYPRWCGHDQARDVDWVNGACMLARREVVAATGGFDEYFFLFAEELDWCLRIWRAGWRVRFLPDAGVVHQLGGTFSASDGRRRILLYQSSMRYFRKNKSVPAFLALHLMIKSNALVRLFLLAGMAGWERVSGRRLGERAWDLVRQQPGPMSHSDSLRMWWGIMTLRTHARIRPATPQPAV